MIERPRTPPAALQKLAQMAPTPPPNHPITVYNKDRLSNLKRGLSAEDKKIADRLKNLQKAEVELPSDEEMSERLAKLKGQPKIAEEKPVYRMEADTRPQVRQSEDLMAKMQEEVKIDGAYKLDEENAVEDIERRLALLKADQSHDEQTQRPKDVEMDSEDEEKAVIAKAMAEADLPDLDEDPPSTAPLQGLVRQLTRDVNDDHEELPWCGICNDDADLRCLNCDRELFCRRCFRECHEEFEMKHRSEPFKRKG